MKENKFNLKEILQDKQKRAILILAIYFIFFLVLTISIRSNYEPNNNNNNNNNDITADMINTEFTPEKITLDNYSFSYTIMKDGVLHTYKGKRYQNKEQFTYDDNEYFKEENKFYKQIISDTKEKSYEEVENPYVYSEYLEFDYLNTILAKSEYISTTNFKDGSNAMSYYMYLDETITENIMTLTSVDNVLSKIEINIDKDSIILEFSDQFKIADFNK